MIEKFLKELTDRIVQNKYIYNRITDGDKFEKFVFDEAKKLAKTSNNFGVKCIEHNGKHSFPDLKIILTNNSIYGLEIKFSASGNWKSKGNSVFETLSNKESNDNAYKEIFILFGRKPKTKEKKIFLEIKYAPYGESIDRVEVTHSPRFAINMDAKGNELANLFGSGETYASFRIKSDSEKNEILRTYFNNKPESSDKWYVPKMSEDDITTVEPTLFSSLSGGQKKRLIAESFILFLDDLLKKKANYVNVAAHMISKHFIYSPSLRDCFSASGKVQIDDCKLRYPKILDTFYNHVESIKEVLQYPSYDNFEQDCYENWEKAFPNIDFNVEDDLVYSYEKIINNFKPCLEVENSTTKSKYNLYVDLQDFYKYSEI